MPTADNWLLPEGVEEILPEEAARLETLRRQLLDLYTSWGYDLVFPPLVEYLESLQIGAGKDLDLQTFKLTDQLTGRTMGLRPDITPQVARMALRYYPDQLPQRLCYAGTAMHSRPQNLMANRTLIQVGVELCGCEDLNGDIEVLNLMIATLKQGGCSALTIDLGHVGIFRGIMAQANLSAAQEDELIDIYHRKAVAELESFVEQHVTEQDHRANLRALEKLAGGSAVLTQAKQELTNPPAAVLAAIAQMEQVSARLQLDHSDVKLYFDLSEIHGYNYHTGLVFAAYVSGLGDAVARGGRYHCIAPEDKDKEYKDKEYKDSQATGENSVSATGFSTDLKTLIGIQQPHHGSTEPPEKVFAPLPATESGAAQTSLLKAIEQFRTAGHRIAVGLTTDCTAAKHHCSHQLAYTNKQWTITSVT